MLFDRASVAFERTVAGLDRRHWKRATVCEITVRELVRHVVAGNEFAVRLLAGATADEALSGLTEVVESGSDDLQEVAESCLAQTNAFKDADEDRLLHHPSGDIDFDTFVGFRLGELVVHGWDLASAVGHAPALDAVVVSALWLRVQGHVDAMRSMGVYGLGATGERTQDAAIEERLLDAFGRRSRG